MSKRLSLSMLGAVLAAILVWLFCKLISPAIAQSLEGSSGSGTNISPMAKVLLGQYGPTFYSVLLSLLFGFMLCGICSFVFSLEPLHRVRFRKALAAACLGGVLFCLSTIFCESAASAVLVGRSKGGFVVHRLLSEGVEYIEWFFWILQSAALCMPVYWSIGFRKKSYLQFAAVVFASAASISVVIFLLQAFITIFSMSTMHLAVFNMVKRYGSHGPMPSSEYLAFQQTFYLIYTLAFAVFLTVLFALVPIAARKGWLLLKSGTQTIRAWEITDPNMSIGSDPMCRICCGPTSGFASYHARIHRYGSEFSINDLGSPAGMLVNGIRQSKAQLRDGDKIRLGDHTFEFTTANPIGTPAPSANNQEVSQRTPSLAPLQQASIAFLVDCFGNRHALNRDQITVGRGTDCDLCLSWEPSVSSYHADIVRGPDAYRIVDKQSSNGTKVNGVAITTSVALAQGDILELGSAKLKFDTEPAVTSTVC